MQWLALVCVRRPVFAWVLMLVIVVLGIVGYTRLGVDQFPAVDIPFVIVTTRLEGASPEEVETDITDKIESAVNTIDGIDELRSTSSEGFSQVVIAFKLERTADSAANDVRDKVNQVLRLLRDSGAGSQHLGTVLQVTDNPAVQALYSEGLAHLSVAEEESSVARAARRLELFLDRLAWTAAREREGSERYLLDRRYDGLVRPRAESRLRERLLRLLGEVSSEEQGTHAWHVVADALAKLGSTAPR